MKAIHSFLNHAAHLRSFDEHACHTANFFFGGQEKNYITIKSHYITINSHYIFTGSTTTVAQSQEPLNHNQEPPPNGHDPLHQGQEPLNLMREAIANGEVCQACCPGTSSSKIDAIRWNPWKSLSFFPAHLLIHSPIKDMKDLCGHEGHMRT